MQRMASCTNDDGFSLLEVVIAIGLSLLVCTVALSAARTMQTALLQPLASVANEAALASDEQHLRADAASANAISTIAAPSGSGISFATIDPQNQWHVWQYRQSSNGLEVQRDGSPVLLDAGITAFQTRFIPNAQLAATGELANSMLKTVRVDPQYITVLDNVNVSAGVFEIRLTRGTLQRTIHLAAAALPSGFGVESGPQWRALVTRTATTKRIFLVGQKTYYNIYGQVVYSYDNWKTQHTWCTAGLRLNLRNGDPNAEVQNGPDESAKAIFEDCKAALSQYELPPIGSNERNAQ